MNELVKLFNNDVFEVAVKLENGEWVFDAEKVAKNLGFTKNETKNDKIYTSIRWERVNEYLESFRPQVGEIKKGDFIPEPAVYKLAFKASNEVAEKFQDWLAIEVLPTLRKEGAFITNNANPEMLRKKADEIESIVTINETAKILLPVFEEAGLKPQYKALALKQIYRKAGIELPIEELKTDKELYDLQSIAKEIGVYSSSNKPHQQVIGYIIKQITIEESEKETVSYENNGHMGTTTQYTYSVIERIKQWLIDNNYPTKITAKQSNGKEKNLTVVYKEVA